MSKEEKSPLKELIDLDELQAIQDSFAKTVGISSVIFSPEGEPLTRFSYPTGFCSLIQSTEEGKRRCFQSFKKMSRKAIKLKKPTILYCFAHGGHFVAPIIINGEHKGTMFAGQFIPQSFSPKQLKALEKTAVEIHLDPQLLTKEAKEMCVIEEDVVEFYSSLLFQIEEFLGRLGAKAAELNRAHDALRKARDALEVRVQERTAELANSNEQLKREITERKRVGEVLKQKTEQQEVLLSSIPAFVYYKDTESNLIAANKAFAEMVNVPIDQLAGKDAYDLFPKEQAKKFHIDDKKVMSSGRPIMNIEETFTDAEGKTRWASTSKVPSFDEKGKVTGMVGITFDITERKRAEEALRESEEKYRTLVESINDIVFTLDREGKFTYLSPRFEVATGYRPEDLIGHSFTEVLAPEYIELTVDSFRRGLSGETIPLYEVELLLRDGRRRPIELNVTSILDVEGQPIGRLGVARDISERKKMEDERKRLLKELEAKKYRA